MDDVVIGEILIEQIQAGLPVEPSAFGRSQAKFLAPLLIAADRGVVIDVERALVAVLRRIEGPVPPRADRGQIGPAELGVGGDRHAGVGGVHRLPRIADIGGGIDGRDEVLHPAIALQARQRRQGVGHLGLLQRRGVRPP